MRVFLLGLFGALLSAAGTTAMQPPGASRTGAALKSLEASIAALSKPMGEEDLKALLGSWQALQEGVAHQDAPRLPAVSFASLVETASAPLPEKPTDPCDAFPKRPPAVLARTAAELEANLAAAATSDKSIVIATVNKGFLPFVRNWLRGLFCLRVENYLLYTVEEETAKLLAGEGHPVYYDAETGLSASEQGKPLDYGTLQYQRLILARTRFVNRVLGLHYRVLLADVDAVWLKNPLPYLAAKLEEDGADLLAQDDSFTPERSHSPCGGFLYLAGDKPAIRALWQRLQGEHEAIVERAVKAGKLKHADEHEQQLLHQYLHDKNNKIKVTYLAPHLFPSGWISWNRNIPLDEAYVVHYNFVIGSENKRLRMVQKGHWILPPEP